MVESSINQLRASDRHRVISWSNRILDAIPACPSGSHCRTYFGDPDRGRPKSFWPGKADLTMPVLCSLSFLLLLCPSRSHCRTYFGDPDRGRPKSFWPGKADLVESRCGAVVLGSAYLFPALSVAGASLAWIPTAPLSPKHVAAERPVFSAFFPS